MQNKENYRIFLDALLHRNYELVSCSAGEINEIRNLAGGKLPDVYERFLRDMGKGAGNFLKGSSCFYPELLEIQEGAADLLRENQFRKLPPTAFIFWMHQGYQFAFFLITEDQDPPIYYYHEASDQVDFVKSYEHFNDFLLAELQP